MLAPASEPATNASATTNCHTPRIIERTTIIRSLLARTISVHERAVPVPDAARARRARRVTVMRTRLAAIVLLSLLLSLLVSLSVFASSSRVDAAPAAFETQEFPLPSGAGPHDVAP